MSAKFTSHNLDEFVLITASTPDLDSVFANECVAEIQSRVQAGAKLIFLDLSCADRSQSCDFATFHSGVAALKQSQNFDLILVNVGQLKAEIEKSRLVDVAQIYQAKTPDEGRAATAELLKKEFNKIAATLDHYMIDAVQAGVQRWIGSLPDKIQPSAPEVDPLQDVVSSVTMQVDGGVFRLFLASSQPVMTAMVTKILKIQVKHGDPLIADGACELLNYLTAYFRQRLSEAQATVDASAPQLMPPAEVMALLDQSPKGHRVYTPLGHFDVWIEVAV